MPSDFLLWSISCFGSCVHRLLILWVPVVLAGTVAAQPRLKPSGGSPLEHLSPQARLAAISHAQVWSPTVVAAMDLKAGPQGPGAFAGIELRPQRNRDMRLRG